MCESTIVIADDVKAEMESMCKNTEIFTEFEGLVKTSAMKNRDKRLVILDSEDPKTEIKYDWVFANGIDRLLAFDILRRKYNLFIQ